jgi:hypothetical protein
MRSTSSLAGWALVESFTAHLSWLGLIMGLSRRPVITQIRWIHPTAPGDRAAGVIG